MKVYVAGKNVERAQKVMDALIAADHSIAYDWIATLSKGSIKEVADKEAEAVRSADLLVYLWEDDQESARYEAGMAMGLEKPVIVSGDHNAFFFQLDCVYRVASDDDVIAKVQQLSSAS